MHYARYIVVTVSKDLGYTLVNIDDCWPAMQRDSQGRLVADPVRYSILVIIQCTYPLQDSLMELLGWLTTCTNAD